MIQHTDNLVHQTEMVVRGLLRYEWMILLGLLLAVLAGLNVAGITRIDSDLFWAIAGIGLAAEATIEVVILKRNMKVQKREESLADFAKLTDKMNEDPGAAVVTLTHGTVGVTMSFHTFKHAILKNRGD